MTDDGLTSLRWMAKKEQTCLNDSGTGPYVPYHVGTTPSGEHCRTMPRVVLVRPDVYRCPACGKEFPTSTAHLAAIEAGEDPAEIVKRGRRQVTATRRPSVAAFTAMAALLAMDSGIPGPDDGPTWRSPVPKQEPSEAERKKQEAAEKRERIRLRNLKRAGVTP